LKSPVDAGAFFLQLTLWRTAGVMADAGGNRPFRPSEQGATFAPLVRKLIGVVTVVLVGRAAMKKEPKDIAKPAVLTFNGISLGATVWVTFFGGIIMFRNMSKDAFTAIQAKLFPPYFALQAGCAAGTALGHATLFGGTEKKGFFALGPAFLLPLLNALFIGPRTTKLLQARAAAVDGSPEYLALHKKFFAYHGMSSICNLGALLGQLSYAWLVSGKLSIES